MTSLDLSLLVYKWGTIICIMSLTALGMQGEINTLCYNNYDYYFLLVAKFVLTVTSDSCKITADGMKHVRAVTYCSLDITRGSQR